MNKKYGHEPKHKCSTLRGILQSEEKKLNIHISVDSSFGSPSDAHDHKHTKTHTPFSVFSQLWLAHNFYFLRLCSCRSSCHLLLPCLTASPQPPFSKLDTTGEATTSESQHLTSIPLSVVGCLTLGLLCLISSVRLYHQLSCGSSSGCF